MNFKTIDYWDNQIWKQAEYVYRQAFEPSVSKSKTIIRRSIERKLCQLHIAIDQSEVIAMSLTGKLDGIDGLLIDYLAVLEDHRNQGTGRLFLDYIIHRSQTDQQCKGVVIEIESEDNPANFKRLHFWQQYGFTLTSYIHSYIWVPETYQAMYLILQPDAIIPTDGEALFKSIADFHNKAYSRT